MRRPAMARSASGLRRRSALRWPTRWRRWSAWPATAGFQFSFAELGTAVEAGAAVIFLVWNNRGYREIEASMRAAGVEPVGVSPAPPDFCRIADAYRMPAERLAVLSDLRAALERACTWRKPCLIEITVD